MVIIFDGNSEHGVHIWYFDLLKAFDYIERVIKSDFFPNKTLFTSYVGNVK